jgi:hypothetical protein
VLAEHRDALTRRREIVVRKVALPTLSRDATGAGAKMEAHLDQTFLGPSGFRCLFDHYFEHDSHISDKSPGPQYSAPSGLTAVMRPFGSSGLSHHSIAVICQNSCGKRIDAARAVDAPWLR